LVRTCRVAAVASLAVADEAVATAVRERWLTRGVAGIGGASRISDLGHEVRTSLFPSFLSSTLGAPAAALGLIEGIANGSGVARLGGGALADDPERRRRSALGGYTATAVFSSLIGITTATWQIGVLHAAAWSSRVLRVPARHALLAEVVPADATGAPTASSARWTISAQSAVR
jgi:hypothetical protein